MNTPRPLAPQHPLRGGPVGLILDTDMGNDVDDALALAQLHAHQTLGEVELLGVTSCKDNALSPRVVDAINTFYGRGAVPVGAVRDGVTPDNGAYLRPIIEASNDGQPRFPTTHTDYPEATALLRRLLADAPDRSVVVVMIGFSTNPK